MNQPPSTPPTLSISPCKLASVLILTAGMLLASTITLKASWLWVLAPVALLMWLEAGQGSRVNGQRLGASGWPFYAGLLAVALAFQFLF